MIRKSFKKIKTNNNINKIIDKYNISAKYLSFNRKSITRGIFIGLFIAFIPMPMQTLVVILLAPLIRYNVPIAITMVWLSNPLTMPFMYYMEYQTGIFILGKDELPNIELTLTWFSNNWNNIVFPLYVGTAFYSIIVPLLVYFIVNKLWINSVKKERLESLTKV